MPSISSPRPVMTDTTSPATASAASATLNSAAVSKTRSGTVGDRPSTSAARPTLTRTVHGRSAGVSAMVRSVSADIAWAASLTTTSTRPPSPAASNASASAVRHAIGSSTAAERSTWTPAGERHVCRSTDVGAYIVVVEGGWPSRVAVAAASAMSPATHDDDVGTTIRWWSSTTVAVPDDRTICSTGHPDDAGVHGVDPIGRCGRRSMPVSPHTTVPAVGASVQSSAA